jgi:tetratricopeptide (TPR) repeat protein
MIEEALNFYEAGNFAAAEPLFRKMLEDEPQNLEVLYILSLALQQQNKSEDATKFLNQAIEIQPGNPAFHIALGNSEVQAGDLDSAEQAYRKATQIDANLVHAQNGLAFIELAQGRAADAEHSLRLALKADPENIQALLNMGIALYEQSRSAEAINYLNKVIAVEPDKDAAHAYLGRAFMAQGNAGFAIQCYKNALTRRRNSVELLHLLGEAQLQSDQTSEAAETYRRLLELEGENPVTLAGLARIEQKLGKLKHAEQMFLRTLHLDPDNSGVLFDYCELLLSQGRYKEVIGRLEHDGLMEDHPDRTRFLLANAKLAIGDAVSALDMMRPLIAQGGLQSEMRLLLARILMETGEADAANTQVDRLLKETTPLADAVIFRARQQLKLGLSEDAVNLLEGLQRRPDLNRGQRKVVATLLGRILHNSGQYHAANEQFMAMDHPHPAVLAIRSETPPKHTEQEAAGTAMERDVAWSWPARGPDDGYADPVFVFGWPGSGRRQVLKALDALPQARVVEDQFSEQRERRWLVSYPRGADQLGELDEAQIRLARRRYWKMLRKAGPGAGEGNGEVAIVDAMWLSADSLPTIYRLFPGSRVIVLKRDPRGMVFSWLQAGIDDLQTMALAYRSELELLDRCQQHIPLAYANVNADELASGPERVLEELTESLSLQRDAGMMSAFKSALHENPLDNESWKHYREWLDPAIAVFDSPEE